MNKAKRYQILAKLRAANPTPTTELRYQSTFELLIAVILSAQSTDVGVNKATDKLYPVANTPELILALGESGLKQYIKTIGLFNGKASNIIKTCQILIEQHGSVVPDNRRDLEALPGVGRKTANVVLGNAFNLAEGVVVDTHVGRLSRRMGLTRQVDPVKVESSLVKLVPKKEWTLFSHLLIAHGRKRCPARKPDCANCEILKLCPRIGAR